MFGKQVDWTLRCNKQTGGHRRANRVHRAHALLRPKTFVGDFEGSSGFTLVEILLVVLIIGVLAAMVIPNLAGRGEQARKSVARADIDTNLDSALGMYEMDNGKFPTTDQGLVALTQKPTMEPMPMRWNGPYLKKKVVPKDPWGRDYVYHFPGTHNTEGFDLASSGPDGVESADDIVNWEPGK